MTDNQNQRRSIHFINALRLQLVPSQDQRSLTLHVPDSSAEAQKLVLDLGFHSETLTLSGRHEVSSVIDRTNAHTTPCTLPLHGGSTLPLGRLVTFCTRPLDYNATQPAGLALAGDGDITVIGPDTSRYQQATLCRGSRQSVVLIDDATFEHAAHGSWPEIFRASSAAIVSSSAAHKITLADSDAAAAKALQNMSRGAMTVIVSPTHLTYAARNQIQTLPVATTISADRSLSRCGAAVAAGLVSGCDAEQSALAAAAAIAGESRVSLTDLIDAGRELVTAQAVRNEREAHSRRRRRTIAAATISALVLLAVTLPWV